MIYKHFMAIFENADKMDKPLKKLPKQKKDNRKLNNPISIKEIDFVLKNFLTKYSHFKLFHW